MTLRSLIASVLVLSSSLVPLTLGATAQETEMQPPLPLTIDFETQGCGRFKTEAYYRTEFHFVNICRGEAGYIMVVTDNDGLGRERVPVEKQTTAEGTTFSGESDRGIQYRINKQQFTIVFPDQKPYTETVQRVSLTGLNSIPSSTQSNTQSNTQPSIKPSTKPAPQPVPLPSAVVTGNIVYRQRIALPPNAVVKVRLQDVSRADAPAVLLAEQTILTNGKQVPIPFSLTYNLSQIQARNTYAVSAQIWVDNQLMWVSPTSNEVITRGNPSTNVEIMMTQVRG